MGKRILILDDPERNMRGLHAAFVAIAGERSLIEVVRTRDCLYEKMENEDWELIVLDHVLEGDDRGGIEVLHDLREKYPRLPVVVVLTEERSAQGSLLMEQGATDYLLQGDHVDISSQILKIKRLILLIEENRRLARQYDLLRDQEIARHQMIGNSPQMREVVQKIEKVAVIPRPVLITGERGTGKELVARAIHRAAGGNGKANHKPIVVVNCAAFTDELLDSALFGHERGAFTGANTRHIGKFEEASGGTLFLDEIGNMSLTFQQKIMRVVEYGTMRRLGGTNDIEVNTRVIAATNADLRKKMEKGEFMRDLYDRLTFEVIHLPPLRDRQGDVAILAGHFLLKFMEEVPTFQGKSLSKDALEALNRYAFPGNIRELKNIIERAVYRDTTNEISAADLDMMGMEEDLASGGSFEDRVSAFELRLLRKGLSTANNNQAEAARLLGLSYHQLRYYLKKYKEQL